MTHHFQTYRLIVAIIMGFTQDRRKPTGSEVAWDKLRHAKRAGELSDDVYILDPLTWDTSHREQASFIDHHLEPGGAVLIGGYSLGGYKAILLADELERRDRKNNHLVLCDAVRNTVFGLSPLLVWKKQRTPSSIKSCMWYYQRENWPRGHRIVDSRWRDAWPSAKIEVPHAYMDEQAEYHLKLFGMAKTLQRAA